MKPKPKKISSLPWTPQQEKASANHQILLLTKNIGTQSVQELFFCDRSICKTVCSNDLVKCTV